jgi:septum formation topological specificity factor MinE
MGAATKNSTSETQDRLALLLIAQPREGWESEFEELIRREIERLAISGAESGHDD